MIKTVTAIEYITPLREGGSLPAIIRADDGELYVMKFIGAGQGRKALIAELICGEIARLLGFNMPELVFITLNAALARSEPHQEIQDLLVASVGLNLGLKFLSHASGYNALLSLPQPSAELASNLVWFDAYTTNVDRTSRNTNLLVQDDKIWLIDHGACLYFHHNWQDHFKQSETPFVLIRDHLLLPLANQLPASDAHFKSQLSRAAFEAIVNQIPANWLTGEARFSDVESHRLGYVDFLDHRLAVSDIFVEEAARARQNLV